MQGSKTTLKLGIKIVIILTALFFFFFGGQQKSLPHCVYKPDIFCTSVVLSQEQHYFCHTQDVAKYSDAA